MILPVNILNFSQTQIIQKNNYFTSINITKQRNTYTDSKISFGNIHHLKEYNWLNAFDSIIQRGDNIRDISLERAFERLYKALQLNLVQKQMAERAKAELHEQNIAAGLKSHCGREFFITETMPIDKEKFIETASAFTRKLSSKFDLPAPEIAIKDFILNDLKISEISHLVGKLPKILQNYVKRKEYKDYTNMLNKIYQFMQKGLIIVNN
jgi:hypothetical protein